MRMRFIRLLSLSVFCVFAVCAFSADDAPPPSPAAEEVKEEEPAGEVEKKEEKELREVVGGVVRVHEGKVYVDHGRNHGVTEGLEMDVFVLEPIEDLDGRVLDVEETLVAKVRVVEVRRLLSVAEVVEMVDEGRNLERGFRVKFMLPVEEEEPEGGERTHCPEGMIYFPSGGFTYFPGTPFENSPGPLVEQEEDTAGFCIDAEPVTYPRLMWVEALEVCVKRNHRLCEKPELRKACTLGREVARPAEGPDGRELKLKEFDKSREWGFDWKDSEDGASMEAGSCSCAGNRPSCFGCYYANCGTTKKKYRCCADPM